MSPSLLSRSMNISEVVYTCSEVSSIQYGFNVSFGVDRHHRGSIVYIISEVVYIIIRNECYECGSYTVMLISLLTGP